MIMPSGGLPFKVGHEMIHLDTFQLLLPALLPSWSLVVNMNASTGLFQFHLCSTLSNLISFSASFLSFSFCIAIFIEFFL